MTLAEIGVAAGATLAAAGVVTLVFRAGRGAWRAARKLGHLFDELLGIEARGSRPAVPGWAERLDQIQVDVSRIKTQVFPNGGTSLRDAVDHLADRVDGHLVEAAEAHRLFVDHLAQHPATVVQVAAPPPPAVPGSK